MLLLLWCNLTIPAFDLTAKNILGCLAKIVQWKSRDRLPRDNVFDVFYACSTQIFQNFDGFFIIRTYQIQDFLEAQLSSFWGANPFNCVIPL